MKIQLQQFSKSSFYGVIIFNCFTLYDAENNVAREKEVLLSLPGKGVDIMQSITDENGKFNFLLESQNGSSDLVFTLPGSEMKIKLEDPFLNDLRFSNNSVLQLDSMALDFLKEKYFHTQLSQRFGKTDYTPASPDTLKNKAFSFHSAPNRIFRTEDYLLLDSVSEYFRELIPSVHFNRKKDGYTLSVIQQKNKLIIGNKPRVFIDGVYYTNYDNIAKIPTDKIDCIEVLWEKYHYKNFTFDGIVSIHTKKADFYSVDLQENMTRIIYPLSDKNSIQFKAKVYSENNRSSKRPDLRYLLYWNPSISTSQLNRLTFNTSDVAGIYEIKLSGYSSNGEWVSHTSEFEVKE